MRNDLYRPFDLTQRTVFGLVGQTLFGVPYQPEQGVDWMAVYRESESQAVRLQVFARHHLLPDLPEDIREDIRRYMSGFMLRNARVHSEHTVVHDLLSQAGIEYTVLKGAASAFYYPDPLTRAMGDVDLYVDESDVSRTMALFRAEGYEVEAYTGDVRQYHLTIRKGRRHIELHYRIPGIPEGEVGEQIRTYLADLRESATLQKGKLSTCRHPSPFHHGLIMLMHLQRHLVFEGIGLRHLCDWAVFVHRYTPEQFEELFRERLSAIGLWRFARLLSLAATLYIGLPEQPWMREDEEDEALACALMQDIVGGGNFGRKDRQRAYEAKFLSKSGEKDRKSDRKHSRITEAIRSVDRDSRERWPIMKRVPLLLPFGWIYATFRYLRNNRIRRKKGRQIDLAQAYKNSERRQELYQALRLYEPFGTGTER